MLAGTGSLTSALTSTLGSALGALALAMALALGAGAGIDGSGSGSGSGIGARNGAAPLGLLVEPLGLPRLGSTLAGSSVLSTGSWVSSWDGSRASNSIGSETMFIY